MVAHLVVIGIPLLIQEVDIRQHQNHLHCTLYGPSVKSTHLIWNQSIQFRLSFRYSKNGVSPIFKTGNWYWIATKNACNVCPICIKPNTKLKSICSVGADIFVVIILKDKLSDRRKDIGWVGLWNLLEGAAKSEFEFIWSRH